MNKKLLSLLLLFMLTACGGNQSALPTAIPNQLSKQTPGAAASGYQVIIVPSVITVGDNRFAVGLLYNNATVSNASLSMTFYDLTDGKNAKAVGTLPGIYREAPDHTAGIYTAEMSFPTAGAWGVDINGKTNSGDPFDQKVGFMVAATSKELPIGQKAPAAKSPTFASAGGDYKKITSAQNPNPAFYQLSLDQALESGRPTLVLFATPAFCSSRLCGPVYDTVNQIYPTYKDRMNFVHVEVYKDLPNPDLSNPTVADAMTAWGLSTDPWTYLIDKNGVVAWRVEGLVTPDELNAAINNLLKTS